MAETSTLLDDAVGTETAAAARHFPGPFRVLPSIVRHQSEMFANFLGPRDPWSRVTYAAFLVLIGAWATLVYRTWATWGDLTIDSGHEMYVPAVLSTGKMLYRDIWFMYGPAAPYFNSYLFRFFGLHLNVLYWAGSLAALGSAIFLYLTGMNLGSWVTGWTAGTILLIEAFERGLFCFPLPYSFSAVYGCLSACMFLWVAVQAARSGRWVWMLGAGTVAALALLLKVEFGVACYGTVVLLMIADSLRQRSWKPIWTGMVAILPGALVCAVVARWMVSIAGADFITQENFMSWPTSYFMKTYGKMWLEHTGFTLSGHALLAAFVRICIFAAAVTSVHLLLRRKWTHRGIVFIALALGFAIPQLLPLIFLIQGAVFLTEHALVVAFISILVLAGVAMAAHLLVRRKRADGSSLFLTLGLSIAALVCVSPVLALNGALLLRRICFPKDMVIIVGLAAIAGWWYGYGRGFSRESLAIGVLFAFPTLLAFRILMGMEPGGYAIYYNGPVILSFLFLASRLIVPELGRCPNFDFRVELAVCFCCLNWVTFHGEVFGHVPTHLVPLTTERGVIRAREQLVMNYEKAIAFMKEKAAPGDSILSIPEDTSLYFLSGTLCPTRVYQFTPGVLAPGKMTEDVIREIERKKVRYLLWSNRSFPEYGVPVFGKDYDIAFAGYLTSHYRPVGPLVKNSEPGWDAVVWERTTARDEHR